MHRPYTRPGQLDSHDLSERAIFSVSVLSNFIRAIFAFICRVFVIFVWNVISRLNRCAYFVLFFIVRRYIFF